MGNDASTGGIGRYADGDTPDTKERNTCASDDCYAFVLTNEEFCWDHDRETNDHEGTDSDPK